MRNHLGPSEKILPPSSEGAVPRRRLFKLLDQGIKRQILWIAAPAGSGKTTLAASYLQDRNLPCLWYRMDAGDDDLATFFYYLGLGAGHSGSPDDRPLPLLTPEYSLGIPTFFRRFFEEVSRRLGSPAVLVFDNYHHVPPASALHDLLAQGLEAVAGRLAVIISSRNEPPVSFGGFQARGSLAQLGWPELRLSREETRAVVRSRRGRATPEKALAQLHAATEGWVAGLVLLAESLASQGAGLPLPEHLTPVQIFNYFAGEVFGKLPAPTREVLLTTALLPVIPGDLAASLTGIPGAPEILARFSREHFFTERAPGPTPAYRYHLLFREFLLAQARATLSAERIRTVQRRGAELLRQAGLIEDAAVLWRECGDWSALAELVCAAAPKLFAQGRAGLLATWLGTLPEEVRQAEPWLLYWQGIVEMLGDLRRGRGHLEQAYAQFKARDEAPGLYLAWAGIIDTFTYEWSDFTPLDRWIAELAVLRHQFPDFPSPEIDARVTAGIFCALMYRQPQHPELPGWEERLKDMLLLGQAAAQLRMVMSSHLLLYYMWWLGDLAKAAVITKTLRQGGGIDHAAPLPVIIWSGIEAGYHWMTANPAGCVESAREGLRMADDSGIHLWDFMLCAQGVYGTLSAGDSAQAANFLARMEASIFPGALQHAGHYHFLAAWEALGQDKSALAEEHARIAHRLVEQAGTPFTLAASKFGLGEVLIERGQVAEALALLSEALAIGRAIRSKTTEFQALIRLAYGSFQLAEEEQARIWLAEGFAMGREQGFFNYAWWRPRLISTLCAKALEAGIEAEYVRELVTRRRANLELPVRSLEEWPWELKIYTLGRFEVFIDGHPLRFSGRVQQTPLNLLKALAAFGGTGVPQEQIEAALWPDSDGDAAHTAFGTNLHRLRKLLANDDFIQVKDGLVTLDPRRVWLDLWAFEKLSEGGPKGPALQDLPDGERALALYCGHLLPGEAGKSWTLSARERLRARYLRTLAAVAERLAANGDPLGAARHYERGLEVDDVAEEFYQGLMQCYSRLGKRAEALSVYERCRRSLVAILDIEPSLATTRLAQTIKKGG